MEPNTKEYLARTKREKEQLKQEMHKPDKSESTERMIKSIKRTTKRFVEVERRRVYLERKECVF